MHFRRYLDDNQLTGTIPFGLGRLHNLVYLYLSNNQLTGPARRPASPRAALHRAAQQPRARRVLEEPREDDD